MTWRIRCTKPATLAAVTPDEAFAHLRLTPDAQAAEGPYVDRLIAAATQRIERGWDIAIMTQEWELTGGFAGAGSYFIPKPPLVSVQSVAVNGAPVASTGYTIEADDRLPGRLSITDASLGGGGCGCCGSGAREWSSSGPTTVVGFTCGRDQAPEDIRQALLMIVATWYENREGSLPFSLIPIEDDAGIRALLDPYRVEAFA